MITILIIIAAISIVCTIANVCFAANRIKESEGVWDIVDYKFLGTISEMDYPYLDVDVFYVYAVKYRELNSGEEKWIEVHKLDWEAKDYKEYLEEKKRSYESRD